jgi:hypothetical protein
MAEVMLEDTHIPLPGCRAAGRDLIVLLLHAFPLQEEKLQARRAGKRPGGRS